jgi:hypothetical protein
VHADGLIITSNEVVKDLLRRAELRAGREPLFAKRGSAGAAGDATADSAPGA